jgi:mRNA interferase MazF
MIKGDIVITPFPFTDLVGNKIRPAIVLINSESLITICFISSQIIHLDENDILLIPNKTNRLKKESIIKINKIATIDKEIIIGEIGQLTHNEGNQLNQALRTVLKL